MNPARRTTAAAAASVVLVTAAATLTAAATPAAAAVTCSSPVFKRTFYANTTFSGTPKRTDCDSVVDQNWGTGAPASGLPANNFGVRWSVTRDFGSGGPFTLSASGLDGVRVYLDPGTADARKISLWTNGSSTVSKTVNVTIPRGKHTLRVDYVNWTGSAKVTFGYSPRTSASVDAVDPLTPAGATVSYDRATGRAKLTWAKNAEMDLAGYRVYRRAKGGSYPATPLATTTSTSYTDATLPVTGAAYEYSVRAYDRAGNESPGTAAPAVTTADRTAPAVPGSLRTASVGDGLWVTWGTVEGAASYRVYRSASADGTYTRVGTSTGDSHTDTTAVQDTTYYYRVTALDTAGNESARSAAVSGKRRDETPPPPVTGVEVTPTEYGFHVTWDPSPAEDIARYVVRRGELWGDEEERVCSLSAGYYVSADTTSYAYRTEPDGEESCFIVDAVDSSWNHTFEMTGEAQVVVATELDLTR
ncbi:PA14 domain-containing protein [Streptomyces sp. NPDC000983]|uniref:fibronectin type III domain-containing protein n=1 Tax=Streptomyces sp. NPDC000983 TaxID=3154373 RepID=UPI00332D649D